MAARKKKVSAKKATKAKRSTKGAARSRTTTRSKKTSTRKTATKSAHPRSSSEGIVYSDLRRDLAFRRLLR